MNDKNIVGRSEILNLTDLSISISAKIDTGAYGNVLHVDNIELIDNKLKFSIYDREFEYDNFKLITVKNSFGIKQVRYSIMTKIEIGDKKYNIRVSLTNRNNMKYPMLIGRRFLRKFKYIVDVRKKNINDTTKKM
jgi:hypothetical protein